MNTNPQRREWLFPIEEAPVLATVTRNGETRNVTVPHKKALVAADTGHIVGIVGAGYKVFTNEQAVTLCHKFCLEAFPDTEVNGNHRVFVEFHFHDAFLPDDGMSVISRNIPDKGSFSQIVRTEREMFDGPWSIPETSKASPNWELRAGVASSGRICERMSSISGLCGAMPRASVRAA